MFQIILVDPEVGDFNPFKINFVPDAKPVATSGLMFVSWFFDDDDDIGL